MSRLNVDQINIILMLLACGLAYLLPFELVLFSYAFLGPAHYLTQISWLHDRAYFTGDKWLWMPFTVLVGIMIAAPLIPPQLQIPVVYAGLAATFAISMALVLAKDWRDRVLVSGGLLAVFAALFFFSTEFKIALVVLLPTVVHVYIFTGCFILLGALKSKSFWGIVSFFVFLFCGAVLFFIVPQSNIISITYLNQGMPFFQVIVDYLMEVLSFNGYVNELSVLGFLSFAYTYHYLNWFSKTELLKWHQIPKRRAKIIVLLYALSIGLYLYDYRVGFTALLLLSLMHVVLEFPLDFIAVKSIPGLLRQRLLKRA